MSVLLAKVFNPAKHDPTGWWLSEKLDGVRAIWTGERFESRTGKVFHAPQAWTRALPSHARLDGELFLDRGKFQETVSIVRRKQPDARWMAIRYIVFDAPDSPSADAGFEERNSMVMSLASYYPFEAMQHLQCRNRDHLDDFYKAITAVGGEGVMLRKPGSMYIPKRSGTLLKMKGVLDGIARVIGHQPGKGKHTGRLGALRCEDVESSVEFRVGTGFSDSERENPPGVGDLIRYVYQELTRDGVPRFPRYLCLDDHD